jgi:lysophospholipase L1-like esterase
MTWYEDEVKALEKKISEYPYPPETVFYGSSSIRLWETLYADFKDYQPINLGFGGSTLAACVWFFDRLVAQLSPKRLIFYAGDNDLGDGHSPEDVFNSFRELMAKVKTKFGDIPFAYISIKPSIARWGINDRILRANQLVADEIKNYPNGTYINIYNHMLDDTGHPARGLFLDDLLHLSPKGYELWKTIVLQYLQNL